MTLLQFYMRACQRISPGILKKQLFNVGLAKRPFFQTKNFSYSPKKIHVFRICTARHKLVENSFICFPKQLLHTSKPNSFPVPTPLLMMLYKFKGLKLLKWISVLVGRSGRQFYNKLPVSIQERVSRHKVAFTVLLITSLIIFYYSYKHHDLCPITGRRRWISFTRDQILVLSDMEFKSLKQANEKKFIDKNTNLYQVCNELVKIIVKQNSDIEQLKTLDWNLNVVHDDDTSNAFVLPNGEIFLFTGMIQLMNGWDELAFILCHEMAHSILGHAQVSYIGFTECYRTAENKTICIMLFC